MKTFEIVSLSMLMQEGTASLAQETRCNQSWMYYNDWIRKSKMAPIHFNEISSQSAKSFLSCGRLATGAHYIQRYNVLISEVLVDYFLPLDRARLAISPCFRSLH